MIQLSTLDFSVILLYLIVFMGIGVWFGRKNKTGDDYFRATKTFPWYVIAFSIFATDMGSYAFITLAGLGYNHGMLFSHYQWFAGAAMITLTFFFLPLYLKSGIFTMPEFLSRRFGTSLGTTYSALTLFIYVIVEIPVLLLTSSIFLSEFLHVNPWLIMVSLAIFILIYVSLGGLKAVVYTDFLQTILIIAGGLWVCYTALSRPEVGGWSGLTDKLDPAMFDAFRPADDPNLPWTAICGGIMLGHLWYWMTNQTITQRMLGARSLAEGRMGILLSSVLKFFIPFIAMVPGMAALLIYGTQDMIGYGDTVFAKLIVDFIPTGVRGLIVITFFAAMMSSCDSILNSAATLFTFDFYKKFFNKNAQDKELIRAGQVAAVVIMALGLVFVSLYQNKESIYREFQNYYAYFSPPITAIFFAAVFSRKINMRGCFLALFVSVGGSILLDNINHGIVFLNDYNNTALVMFLVSVLLLKLGSISGKPVQPEQLEGTSYHWLRKQPDFGEEKMEHWWFNRWIWIGLYLVVLVWTSIRFGLFW